MLRRCLLLTWGLCLLLAGAAHGASPLADLAEVDAALARGAIVWDVRPAAQYRDGHLPGAVNLPDPANTLRDEHSERLLSLHRLEQLLGQAGIDPAAELIVYGGRGSPQAYFARHALLQLGASAVRVYHDGIDGWRAAGRMLQRGEVQAQPRRVVLWPQRARVATTNEVVAAARDAGDVQLIDVRTHEEHVGIDVRAIRGGHIPGSVNIPFELNWRDPLAARKLVARQVGDNAGMALKDRDALLDLYSVLDPNRPTIVYCQSGTRSAVTAAVLEDLGFRDVRVYDDSWLGYAARLDAPAVNESFVNVGRLLQELRALKARLDAVEHRQRGDAPARVVGAS